MRQELCYLLGIKSEKYRWQPCLHEVCSLVREENIKHTLNVNVMRSIE